MATVLTAEDIKAMATRVLNIKYHELDEAMEVVCGKFSEETKDTHVRVWEIVEGVLCNEYDIESVGDRI